MIVIFLCIFINSKVAPLSPNRLFCKFIDFKLRNLDIWLAMMLAPLLPKTLFPKLISFNAVGKPSIKYNNDLSSN